MKIRMLSASVIKPEVTSVSQLAALQLVYF